MKKLRIFNFFALMMISSIIEVYAQCSANELTGLSVSKDNNCESVQFHNYNQVNITAIRNFQKQGKFKFKLRRTGSSSWVNLPINFNVDTINGSVYTNEFHYIDNGEFRCIFYETGTGCKDTLYTTITVNKAPRPSISFDYTCYGGLFTISDSRNPSGVGNSYARDSGGHYIPCNKTIPVTCNGCFWIVPVGGPQVRVTNSLGCSAITNWVGAIFNSNPPIYTITATQSPIGPGQSSTLSASSNYPVSNYKWYKTGNSMLLGTDSVFTITYPDTGKYKVRIKNTNGAGGCIINKFITVSGSNSIRIEDDVYNDELVVYPNPASNSISISGYDYPVEIMDSHGRTIYSQHLTDQVSTIDISKFSSGIYFVRTGDRSVKFIKQ